MILSQIVSKEAHKAHSSAFCIEGHCMKALKAMKTQGKSMENLWKLYPTCIEGNH